MEAGEATVFKVLERTTQFLVPHFQRPYAWTEPQWRVLWEDIVDRVEHADGPPHFIGPIVTAPAKSIPEGVEKRLLIDGQQRLTTLLVLLTAIRDDARRTKNEKLAERIQDLLTNRHEEGADRFKLLPTQGETVEESDRAALAAVVDGTSSPSRSGIIGARQYFNKRILRGNAAPEKLYEAVTRKLALVSIILGERDNPYRIFESLNGKGQPLSQGDLIRNFFFMQIDQREHERIYTELWRPMQRRVGEENLTEFIRHQLSADLGVPVRQSDVYGTLKERVDADGDAIGHLRRLGEQAAHYAVLLDPRLAPSPRVAAALARLDRLEVTVAYPLLLPAYAAHAAGTLPETELLRLLDVIETYIVRRFVCGVATHGLNRIFPAIVKQHGPVDAGFVDRVATHLAARDCPGDAAFRKSLQATRLYAGGERRDKAKLILERLEGHAGHKEAIDPATLTIEHIMPQTLTEVWIAELGADAAETHAELLHTLGNLTLTGYNAELGNLPYAEKRRRYADSHLELNREFAAIDHWTRDQIERRAAALAEQAATIWPWFGPPTPETTEDLGADEAGVTGTTPETLEIADQRISVWSWVDVAREAAEAIAKKGDVAFDRAAAALPKFLNVAVGAQGDHFARNRRCPGPRRGCSPMTNLRVRSIMAPT